MKLVPAAKKNSKTTIKPPTLLRTSSETNLL
jgi:hypothetical protein